MREPAAVFAVLMLAVLVAPLVAERLRIPGLVGLVGAGALIGPHTFGIVEREGAVAALGSVGLLYLMFVAGLELDLHEFRGQRRQALVFGVITFVVPMAMGIPSASLLGYPALAAVLIASCWASHTLLVYPAFRRFGVTANRAVSTAVGGTMIADTTALLVLAGVVRAYRGGIGPGFWAELTIGLALLLAVSLWVLPAVTARLLRGLGQDRTAWFLYVAVALFAVAALAQLSGIEPIVGAFLAGLALNRFVPSGSVLMERVEFLGSALLIPLFLISVGMLVDPRVLFDPGVLREAAAFTVIALGAKLIAAVVSGGLFRFSRDEVLGLFSLSGAQAAATLAAVIVGLQIGLLTEATVNAVLIVILATCLTTGWVAERIGPRLARPPARRPVGHRVIVPVIRPESAAPLVRLAAHVAKPDGGSVLPLSVVSPHPDAADVDASRLVMAAAEAAALTAGVGASAVVRVDASPTIGVLHAAVEQDATLLVAGWRGPSGPRETLLGSIVDSLVTRATVPLLVARLSDDPFRRLVLVLEEDNLNASGGGLLLATDVAARVAAAERVPVAVLSTVAAPQVSDVARTRLRAPLHVEPSARRSELITRSTRSDDLVVLPVQPAGVGLLAGVTRLGRAGAAGSLLFVFDIGSGDTPAPAHRMPAADSLHGPADPLAMG